MKKLKWFLWPFSVLYGTATFIRNYLFDAGIFKSVNFDVKTIGVGNLKAGGTGKTPMVEYLIRLLKDQYQLATLSRGYGRKTSGFMLADSSSDAITIGDEPMQFFTKYGKEVAVSVGEDRMLAIPLLMVEKPDTEVILLDDVFQHRTVLPNLNILLTEYNDPFFNDYLLPVGLLRERRRNAIRADILVFTKCPGNISAAKMDELKSRAAPFLKAGTPVFFAATKYLVPVHIHGRKTEKPEVVVGVSGIAKSDHFEAHLKANYNLKHHFSSKDHHRYTIQDVQKIVRYCRGLKNEVSIITTEKDMAKLRPLFQYFEDIPLFFLPIECYFVNSGEKFDNLVRQIVQNNG